MDAAYVSTLSALAGSAIGGSTSTGVTWLNQRGQTRSAHEAQAFARREELYRDFILAAFQNLRRRAYENRAADPRARRSLFDDQPDVGAIQPPHRRERTK
jgi:hypothetical protein